MLLRCLHRFCGTSQNNLLIGVVIGNGYVSHALNVGLQLGDVPFDGNHGAGVEGEAARRGHRLPPCFS